MTVPHGVCGARGWLWQGSRQRVQQHACPRAGREGFALGPSGTPTEAERGFPGRAGGCPSREAAPRGHLQPGWQLGESVMCGRMGAAEW